MPKGKSKDREQWDTYMAHLMEKLPTVIELKDSDEIWKATWEAYIGDCNALKGSPEDPSRVPPSAVLLQKFSI